MQQLKKTIPNVDGRGIVKAKCESTWDTIVEEYFNDLRQEETQP